MDDPDRLLCRNRHHQNRFRRHRQNLFNPALAGRVFLFISFPVQMTTWVRPHLFDFMNTDVTTSATTLNILKHVDAASSATQLTAKLDKLPDYLKCFSVTPAVQWAKFRRWRFCWVSSTCYTAKVVSWHIPFYYLGTFFILTGICWLTTSSPAVEPITHLFVGRPAAGGVFMATDYTTSPMSENGKIILPSAAVFSPL